MFSASWSLTGPSVRRGGDRSVNLVVLEGAFRKEAGDVPDLSATEQKAGDPPPFRWSSLFESSESVAPLQTIHLAGTVRGRRMEASFAIGQASQGTAVTTVEWFTSFPRALPGRIGMEKPRFHGWRFVADDGALADRLNAAPSLVRLLNANIRSSYEIMRDTMTITPGFQLAAADGGTAMWVRTTLKSMWWSFGMAHELGVADFAAFAGAMEDAL